MRGVWTGGRSHGRARPDGRTAAVSWSVERTDRRAWSLDGRTVARACATRWADSSRELVGRTDGLTDCQLDGQAEGRTDRRMGGLAEGRSDRRADGRTDLWTDGRTE